MFQATRRRLAIWYTTVTAILLLLFATGVYLYVRATLIERVDDTLKHVVEVIERSLVIETSPLAQKNYHINLEGSFRHNAKAVEDDHIDLELFNPHRELLWSTFPEPLDFPLSIYRTPKTVNISNHILRQVTSKIEFQGYIIGYLRVSHPWFEVTKPSRQFIIDLSIGIIILIICVGGIGWFLSGIAIQPVKDSYQKLKQFTADASHELRNPIAMIQTNVQTALAYPNPEWEWQQKQLEVIERLTQRLGALVNDLLFLARSDSGIIQMNYQLVPLDALLIEIIEEQRIIAQQKEIFLCVHFPETESNPLTEDPVTIQGDWEQLARLFTNLISNALENFPPHFTEASIEVELESLKRDRHNYLQVKIKDNGIGMPPEALPNIFDRFYRVDPARSHQTKNNSGLGLAIAKTIVENHHGQINVESMLNQGTTFTVILPIANQLTAS